MSKGNEQIDDDILQCKEDVLRSRDDAASGPEGKGVASVKDIPVETARPKEPSALMEAVVEANKKTAVKTPELGQAKPNPDKVLKFDLAEEIMSEQRKITAIRRKSPGNKAQIEPLKSKSGGGDAGKPKPKLPERNQIIAEIVARDIKRLCQGLGVPTEKITRMG